MLDQSVFLLLNFWRIHMSARKFFATVIALAATVSSSVQAAEFVTPDAGFVSMKSRAEVINELKQAQSAGTLLFGEDNYPLLAKQHGVQPDADSHDRGIRSASQTPFAQSIYFGA
jgi:hypothetical protein